MKTASEWRAELNAQDQAFHFVDDAWLEGVIAAIQADALESAANACVGVSKFWERAERPALATIASSCAEVVRALKPPGPAPPTR